MAFTTPDVVIIGLIALSVLIGVVRGFIKELISLITWIVAICLAVLFTAPLATFMTFTSHEMLQMLVAFLLIFVGTIFAGAVLNFIIGSFVRKTPFSIPDRILGSFFGFLRGLVFMTILVLLGGLTSFPQAPWWKQSPLIAQFQIAALWLKEQLPEEHAKGFRLPGEGEQVVKKQPIPEKLKDLNKKKAKVATKIETKITKKKITNVNDDEDSDEEENN